MNRKTLINSLLITAAVVVVVVCAFSVRTDASFDSVAVLRTLGMTCGSCAVRIEKTLKAEGGVEAVNVDVGGGQVVVGYDSKRVRPERIAEKVTGTGYGSSILQVLTADEYRTMNGRGVRAAAAGGGCGGGCCPSK